MSNQNNNLSFATRAIHGPNMIDPTTGAVMPGIFTSTTFQQRAPGTPIGDFEYTRSQNPTRATLEKTLADLENGKYGFSFASGCAALSTLLHCLPNNAHVILSDDVYGGTMRIFEKIFSQRNLTFSICDFTKLEEIKKNINNNTRLIWCETPSNPLLKIIDIQKIASLKSNTIWLAVDNTFATPYLQEPLNYQADIVCHSTTKYIGGHSDVLGGALICNKDEIAEKIQFHQNAIGAVPSPWDCYLLIRSIKTLSLRMQRHCYNAKMLAEFLQEHQKVESVRYPGLPSHPGHETANMQMADFGGMITFNLKGGLDEALSVLKKLKLFTLAESLGGVESLIEHPALMTHAAIPESHRKKLGIDNSMLRISCGIEEIDDLIDDFEQAL